MIPYTTVIVTYSNRGHLLSSVVSSTVSSGCDHVIIIDNGSDVESKKLINELPALYNLVKFTVSTNDRNEGSAIAFSHGMDLASNTKNEFVLFLDDDNLLEEGAVQRAINIASQESECKSVFFLLREDRPHYMEFIRTRRKEVLLGEENSFMAFTLKKYIKNIFSKKININEKHYFGKDSVEYLSVPCGPYGGMLTRKSILNKGMRPMKDMILYFDDTKYTYDLSSAGIKLYLLTNCLIKDIDDSWSAIKTSKLSSPIFSAGDFKIHHTIRNRMFFEMTVTTTRKSIYIMNIFSFMLILFLKALLSNNLKVYLKILRSICDGFDFYEKNKK
ncbi:glycosyltransferase [Klebsiella pneumoniae]|uniref:glycosyltransferase family 2 protein n=1 Tax=Klebsiella pneumoniae TaxID=573 RepID=UPI003315ADAE|nr:glycosyltransferase [Klebsiella pneumoniae]HBV4401494.1 glycosyltransferase [Klebsiella pneumoniae]